MQTKIDTVVKFTPRLNIRTYRVDGIIDVERQLSIYKLEKSSFYKLLSTSQEFSETKMAWLISCDLYQLTMDNKLWARNKCKLSEIPIVSVGSTLEKGLDLILSFINDKLEGNTCIVYNKALKEKYDIVYNEYYNGIQLTGVVDSNGKSISPEETER